MKGDGSIVVDECNDGGGRRAAAAAAATLGQKGGWEWNMTGRGGYGKQKNQNPLVLGTLVSLKGVGKESSHTSEATRLHVNDVKGQRYSKPMVDKSSLTEQKNSV